MSSLRSLLSDVERNANFNPNNDRALLFLKNFTESTTKLLKELVTEVESMKKFQEK